MNKRIKILASALCICILATLAPARGAQAYTPKYSVIKVGLYYGSSLLPSANLANVSDVGLGKGFEFGYYDSNRSFISIGASTERTAISIMKDWNMYYDSSSKGYLAGTNGSIVVGCHHIQYNTPYTTYAEARAAADGYASGFVKYTPNGYYLCAGQYTSKADAENAASGMSGWGATSGTANTIAIVATGTNTILLEFDGGSSIYLTVRPIPSGGVPQTLFRNAKYYGDFQYTRPNSSTGDLAVINIVDIEQYTKCVVPRESPRTWPLEALKVQALCARTYSMANLNKHGSFDLCTTDECQVYGGLESSGVKWTNETTDRAVEETAGQYITYNGQLCQTFFSSSDGGGTENSENVWKEAIPYLRGVIDPYEASIPASAFDYNYSWTITYTPEQLTQRLRDRGGKNCSTIVSMQVTKYSATGNAIEVTLKDSNGQSHTLTRGDQIRYVLSVSSIHFTVGGATRPGQSETYVNGGDTLEGGVGTSYAIGGDGTASSLPGGEVYAIDGNGDAVTVGGESSPGNSGSSDGKVNGVFTISGTGRGHNVGVSQWGTYAMAYYHNKTYLEIINFYYTGVTIG